MAYQITNVSSQTHSSTSASLVPGASIILNVNRLPIDLAPALAAGILRAEKIDTPELFVYDWAGFTNRAVGLGNVMQYLPLNAPSAVPATVEQNIFSLGKKRLLGFMGVLSTPPGSGNSRKITIQRNNADTILSLTFSDSGNGPRRISGLVQVEDLDQLQLKCDVTGNPVNSQFAWSVTLANAGRYV